MRNLFPRLGSSLCCVQLIFAVAACQPGTISSGRGSAAEGDGGSTLAEDALPPPPAGDAGSPSNGPLHAPADLLGRFVAGGYRLTWSDTNAQATHYVVERAAAKGGLYKSLAMLGADATTFTDGSYPASGRPVYRVRASAGNQQGPAAECDSGVKAWTYIRIVGYDALWGSSGPTMSSLKDSHLKYALEGVTDRKNINLVLFGDSYGAEGTLYAHVGDKGTTVLPRPEANTGDPGTYRQLFDWVVQNHPGQRYAISYWSHGSGFALGFDDTSKDQLTTQELAAVLDHLSAKAKRKIEVFFVCACLQQMVENAYALRESVRYVVAGESTVGCGCDILSVLKDNLDKDAGWLAKQNTSCQTTTAFKKDVVYSSVRTDRTVALATAIDQLAVQLKGYADRGAAEAAKLKNLAGNTQNMSITAGDQYSAHLDLVDLCKRLPQLNDDVITKHAQQVESAASTAAITQYVVQNDSKGLYSNAHGLAIFHPNPQYPYYFQSYGARAFAKDTRWDEYLKALYP